MWKSNCSQARQFDIHVVRQEEGVYTVWSKDVLGLNLEAESVAEMVEELKNWIPELLADNGVVKPSESYRVLIHRPDSHRPLTFS